MPRKKGEPKSKIKRVAQRVSARQSERHGRTLDKGAARKRAKAIIADRAPARKKAAKAVKARNPGLSGQASRTRGAAIVSARSAPKKTGPNRRTRAVSKSAAAVSARHSNLSPAEARARARAIVKKRKRS